jgi:hypothetical protein
MDLRQHFRLDCPNTVRDGETFTIIALEVMGAEGVGGDHPEYRFGVRFEDGSVNLDVAPECIFEGYDPVFDDWCIRWPIKDKTWPTTIYNY